MQLIASILALAALSTATPHLQHRNFHQKKSPMPDVMEALTAGLPALNSVSNIPAPVAQVQAAPAAAASPAAVQAQAAAPVAASSNTNSNTNAVAAVSNVVNSVTSAVNNLAVDISSTLSKLACKTGQNSQTNNGAIWLGSDGKWTNTFTNNAGTDMVLVIWGSAGSWVNAVQPYVTMHLAAGSSQTVSFADGQSGAWTGIYPDTQAVNGQIANTWGEFTFGPYSTVDVSREVNMSGHGMSITTPNCVSDMNTCVFVCDSGNSCEFGYSLKNCANGSQKGATYGTYAGAASGGCGNMGSSANLQTSLF